MKKTKLYPIVTVPPEPTTQSLKDYNKLEIASGLQYQQDSWACCFIEGMWQYSSDHTEDEKHSFIAGEMERISSWNYEPIEPYKKQIFELCELYDNSEMTADEFYNKLSPITKRIWNIVNPPLHKTKRKK